MKFLGACLLVLIFWQEKKLEVCEWAYAYVCVVPCDFRNPFVRVYFWNSNSKLLLFRLLVLPGSSEPVALQLVLLCGTGGERQRQILGVAWFVQLFATWQLVHGRYLARDILVLLVWLYILWPSGTGSRRSQTEQPPAKSVKGCAGCSVPLHDGFRDGVPFVEGSKVPLLSFVSGNIPRYSVGNAFLVSIRYTQL